MCFPSSLLSSLFLNFMGSSVLFSLGHMHLHTYTHTQQKRELRTSLQLRGYGPPPHPRSWPWRPQILRFRYPIWMPGLSPICYLYVYIVYVLMHRNVRYIVHIYCILCIIQTHMNVNIHMFWHNVRLIIVCVCCIYAYA